MLESALNTPFQTFEGEDVYPSLQQKAASLGFGLVKNHPFIDGNKRIGAHAMLVFLALNGVELKALSTFGKLLTFIPLPCYTFIAIDAGLFFYAQTAEHNLPETYSEYVKSEVEVVRTRITLACTECKNRNYNMTKDKKTHPDRMETKKYCKFCKSHTLHKETK